MKEENIQDAYYLSNDKFRLQKCIEMVENAKNIDDLQRAHQRSELDIDFPSLSIFKEELIAGINNEIKIISAKIEAL